MAAFQRLRDCRGRVLLFFLLGILGNTGATQIRYSVPEEMEKGSFVGDMAKDLGLQSWELAERRVRIVSRGKKQHFALNSRTGSLVTADRIDREELCAQSAQCLLNFNVLVEDKVKLFAVEVEITDINDNVPKFQVEQVEVKITESAAPGMRFPLPEAFDPDVGMNSLQGYELRPKHHFSLFVQNRGDGAKYPELVLEKALDREEKPVYHLILTAADGGDPAHSGTVQVLVTVLDANDNAPVFTQSVYSVSIPENVPKGTLLLAVNATDPDEGVNGEVTYSFRRQNEKSLQIFQVNAKTGEITTAGDLDYEKSNFYEIEIQAEDGDAFLARAKVLVTVLDLNDNSPEVTITSLFSPVTENSPSGTVIALLNIHDQDSGENGLVTCSVSENLPFKLEKSIDSYHRLVTNGALDREKVSAYNITITAVDQGTPPLSVDIHIFLQVADTNDNPPIFSQVSYSAYIEENNARGASIYSVIACDLDSEENSHVSYSIEEDIFLGAPLSSYISINSENGILYALHSFDYEQFREMQLQVTARDSGNPPLSNNVSLTLFILDQNDNAPEILYPVLPTDGSTGVELAPRSAEPGYLVTKVVAVDRDSGQNAWLSYRLFKVTEPGLFSVGLHTGEIRTARAFTDKDALKQNLMVVVSDKGEPPLSATISVTVAVADRIPEILSNLGSQEAPSDLEESSLTLYLVIAVASISSLFFAFVIVLLALRIWKWRTSQFLGSGSDHLGDVSASQFMGIDGVQAFLQTYCHEVSLTTDSRKSHLIFPQPNYADTLLSQHSYEKTKPLLVPEDDSRCSVHDPPLATVSLCSDLFCSCFFII